VSVVRAWHLPHGDVEWRRQIREPVVTVSLVAAACLFVEAVIAKNVIDVELDFFSQFAAMWIFIAYLVSGLRDRRSAIAFSAVMIVATAAILVLFAV
jgi:hypothetical protein